jgi:hypothetical protein
VTRRASQNQNNTGVDINGQALENLNTVPMEVENTGGNLP